MDYLTKPILNKLDIEQIHRAPIFEYSGAIECISTPEKLLKITKNLKHQKIIGIDTESRPSFSKGLIYPVSLIQIATEDIVYVIQINMTGFSDELVKLFENKKIIKAGLAINDDIKKLRELRDFEPKSFVDLSKMAREKGIIQTGLKSLSVRYLNCKISKTARTTNWSVSKLTQKQLVYAATDAWMCLKLYPIILSDTNDYHEKLQENQENQKDQQGDQRSISSPS